jgi:hypothetical protein
MNFMDGESNRGIAVSSSSNRQSVYNAEVIIGGDYDPDCAYGVAEVASFDENKKVYTVRRPSASSQPWQICALMPSQYDRATDKTRSVAMFSNDNRPVLVAITDDSGEPEIGDSCGTVAGSWKLQIGKAGFIVVAVAEDDGQGSGGRRLVYVRPFSSAGAPSPRFYAPMPSYSFVRQEYFGGVDASLLYTSREMGSVWADVTTACLPKIGRVFGLDAAHAQDFNGASGAAIFSRQTYNYYEGVTNSPALMAMEWGGLDPSSGSTTPLYVGGASHANYAAKANPTAHMIDGSGRIIVPWGDGAGVYSLFHVDIYGSGYGGASVTGSIASKAGLTQSVGSSTLTVTTAAGDGAIDLKSGNLLSVGSGDDARKYSVTADVSEPNPATDATIQIYPPLEIELTGGETVGLVPSFILEHRIDGTQGAISGPISTHTAGYRHECDFIYYPFTKDGVQPAPASDFVAGFYWDGSSWSTIQGSSYDSGGYTQRGDYFTTTAVSADGTIYGYGTIYDAGSSTVGLFFYDSGAWTNIALPTPSGATTLGGTGRLCQLPDGRVLLSAQWYFPSISMTGNVLYLIRDGESPVLLESDDGPFIFYWSVRLVGVSQSGWRVPDGEITNSYGDIYLLAPFSTSQYYQVINTSPARYITMLPGGAYRLTWDAETDKWSQEVTPLNSDGGNHIFYAGQGSLDQVNAIR